MKVKLKPKRTQGKSHLSYTQIGLALKLRDEGKTQDEIAQCLNRDRSAIAKLLLSFVDTRPLATLRLHNRALGFAETVIRDANVEESLEMLDRLEVVPKRQIDQSKANQVNIVIGMPGHPIGPDLSPSVTIDLHKVTDDHQLV